MGSELEAVVAPQGPAQKEMLTMLCGDRGIQTHQYQAWEDRPLAGGCLHLLV